MLIHTQAIVLAGQKLGEADTLVTLLTLERGLVKGVAKNVRRMRSRFGSALQPFSYGEAILFERRAGVLHRINHVDLIHSFQVLREDLERITWAAAMSNAARTILPEEQPSRETFMGLLRSLKNLEAGDAGTRVAVFFLLGLLRAAGYQPRLDRCLLGHHSVDGGIPRFIPRLGGIVCSSCYLDAQESWVKTAPSLGVSPGTRAFLQHALRTPVRIRHRLQADLALLDEAHRLLQACLVERARRTPVTKRPWSSVVRSAETAGFEVNTDTRRHV